MTLKDVGIRMRIDKELREAFVGVCAAVDRQASEVLREYMRAYADPASWKPADKFFAEPSRDMKPRR